MAFSTPGNGSPTAQINITPLIDVLLVLIIVFMVVVSMSQEKGLDTEVPQPTPDSTTLPSETTIVIQVMWDAKTKSQLLKINQEDVSWDNLHSRLQRIFLERAERVAYVKGDDDVDFQYVADVIDIARNSGVDRVGLLGKQQ
jgi:biopolymer transport protein TolR